MNSLISALHLTFGLFFVGLVIAFASTIIPIVLSAAVGFFLILWLYAHLVDGMFRLSRKIQRWTSSHS